MDANFALIFAFYFAYCMLKDVRDQLIAIRLKDDLSFINVGWIRYRRLSDGTIETIGSNGFKVYKSEADFKKKTGKNLC